jgi:creatinine amidohydrolase/Fe(II)-dependent formamide hydrolase-like protein
MKKSIFALAAVLAVAGAFAAAQQGPRRAPDPRSMGGGDCRDNPYNCADAPNPLPKADTVWLEEMTWMDVRDALKAGTTTAIISTGGIEPNGPWLVLGKHNYVLRANCDAIARKLGNAVCAPIIPLVPEGGLEPKTGHMTSPGTITMRDETFQAVLTDTAASLKSHGFTTIVFIGDSGGNQAGQKTVAEKLTAQWAGSGYAYHIPEYYDYASVTKMLEESGFMPAGRKSDGMHDDPAITLNMFITDPKSVRYDERVKAGKATIDCVSLTDRAKATETARKIVAFRAEKTVAAIQKAIASKGKTTMAPQ